MSAEGPILVFDGVCVLCSRSVQFVLRHDRQKRFRFATTQSTTGARLMTEHGLDASKPASVLLIEDDRSYTESAAMIRVLRSFGGAWPLLAGAVWVIPKPLRDAAYRAVANRRYRWFGQRETCYLPDPSDAGRFLQN
jgi:predicted DCC family thiol-disulfide oxidoreductase YuxK